MRGVVDTPDIKDISDKQLVAEAQNGRESAFSQLQQRYQTALFSMVFRHLGHREEAEDIVQQVFLKAYQHINAFRGESKIYTWMYTIALNLVRNHIRQRYTRRTVSLDDMGSHHDGPAPQWAEKGPSPEEEAARHADIEAIRDSLVCLGEEQRTIFVWHYFQQLPMDAIARRLDRPLGTVKVYLHRARKTVYKALTGSGKGKGFKNMFLMDKTS